MKTILSEWIEKKVQVILRATVPTTSEGKLVAADATGVLLEIPRGQALVKTFVPFTSILHISMV